jgi:hypothetical protein
LNIFIAAIAMMTYRNFVRALQKRAEKPL